MNFQHCVSSLTVAAALLTTPAWAVCPSGPDQCKQGLVWRDAFSGDHACVSGAVRAQAADDNRQAPQRKEPIGDACKFGFVWREAAPHDHVCVTGLTRAQTAQQNRDAPGNIDPLCRPSPMTGLRTEYLRHVAAPLPPKRSYSYTTVQPDGKLVGVSHAPLSIATDLMWNPGDVLRVSITGGSNVVKEKIQRYANEWSRWANIRFIFVADPTTAHIRAEVNSDGTSWSVLGRAAEAVAAPEKTMNFGWLTDTTADDEYSRVVTHEFGHALGLIHEHQSPVAGIPWDRPKVIDHYKNHQNPPWDEAQVQANIFDQANSSTTNFSQFDPQSIMLYSISAALTTNGYSVGTNRWLSSVDKQYIAKFYPFPPGVRGTLFTGDDCDTVGFETSHGTPDQDGMRFVLRLGPNVTWWKSIEIPTQGGGYVEVQAQDQLSGDTTVGSASFDTTRPIRFNKAKFVGNHTRLDFTWDVMPALASGSRVVLDWNKDRCTP